jgi:hypothetical protein
MENHLQVGDSHRSCDTLNAALGADSTQNSIFGTVLRMCPVIRRLWTTQIDRFQQLQGTHFKRNRWED